MMMDGVLKASPGLPVVIPTGCRMRAGLRAEVGLGRAVPGWQRWAEAEQVFEAELGVGLRELAVDRVRGELVEEREDLVEDAALVALDALEADDFAALSQREALAEPVFELLVVDAAPLERLAVDALSAVDERVVEHPGLGARLEQ